MSKVVKKIKKAVKTGVKSVTKRVKGALKGDLSDITSLVTLGGSDRIKAEAKLLQKGGSKIMEAITPKMPELPDIPTAEDIAGKINIDIPEPTSQGAIQSSLAKAAPSIDLGSTEGSRRRSGSALGRRKLRVPLGGLK